MFVSKYYVVSPSEQGKINKKYIEVLIEVADLPKNNIRIGFLRNISKNHHL